MGRLFLAIDLPSEYKEVLAALDLPGGTRRVPAERLHLTVRFIGNADEDVQDQVAASVGRFVGPAPSISVGGVGSFPRGSRARVLWAGVQTSAVLVQLQAAAERLCQSVGISEGPSVWMPHVTLARLRVPKPVDSWLLANASLALPPFSPNRLTLFDSRHEKGVLRYHPLAQGVLLGPSP